MTESSPKRIGDATFAAIDFESAGEERGQTDVPIQIGIGEMRGGQILKETFFCSFLRTERSIAWTSRDVHNIRDDDLKDAPSLLDLWPELNRRLSNRLVVAHSCGTEKKFLRVFAMHQFGPWVDTLKVARAFYPGLPSHTLGDLLKRFVLEDQVRELCPGREWHDALFDSVAALVLLRYVIKEAKLAAYPADALIL
jgi:DNA polymerase-3 subunit epsilon